MRLRGLHLLVLALALGSNAAQARRVAIIIANEGYASEARLYNPLRDASAIAAALGPQGAKFDQVLVLRDLNLKGMRRALQTITATSDADALIVYYSGHGMRDGYRRNFLLPVDAQISKPDDIAAEGIDAEELVTAVRAAQPKLGLIVLDACRNNPFYEALGTKGTMKGLERRGGDGLNGVLVAYAAEGGQTADDGRPGSGSPFATAFARRIATPGTPLLALLDDISDEVASVTKGRQVPTRDGNLRASAMLLPAVLPPPRPTPAVVAAPDLEREAWDLCKAASVAGPCRAYLASWRSGTYAGLAKVKIDSLTVSTGGGTTFVPAGPDNSFVPAESASLAAARRAIAAISSQLWSTATSDRLFNSFAAAGGTLRGLSELAGAGNRDGMTLLAFTYLVGNGGQSLNQQEAFKWLEAAANAGQASAQNELGFRYADGKLGLNKNETRAANFFQIAAGQGNAAAQTNLGDYYRDGLGGVPKDPVEAVSWYRKAVAQGYAFAQNNLGYMYDAGLGVSQDKKQALWLYKLAAEQGNAVAQKNVGIFQEQGLGGLANNTAEAIVWYRKAAAQGNEVAIAALKRLGVTP